MNHNILLLPWLGNRIGWNKDGKGRKFQRIRCKFCISGTGIAFVNAHDLIFSLVHKRSFLCIIDRLIRNKGSVRDIIAFKQLHIQFVANLPLLVLCYLFADKADLRTGFILLFRDEPALTERCISKVKGRNRGDIIGCNYIVCILLDMDVLPEILEVGFQLRVILHILPALDWEWGVTDLILHPFPASIVSQLDIPVILKRYYKIKGCLVPI